MQHKIDLLEGWHSAGAGLSDEKCDVHSAWATKQLVELPAAGDGTLDTWDATCHTPFREIGNEASIRVPRMFKSHAWQQYDKQMQYY
jgi:hypothetical protein